MATTTTYQVLSCYQIHTLRELFLDGAEIAKIAICHENGEVVITYSGGKYSYDGEIQTRRIPKAEQIGVIKNISAFPWTVEWITAPGLEQLDTKNTENDGGAGS